MEVITSNGEEQMFAYGQDARGDCACPAQHAGWSPGNGDESTEIAEAYDNAVLRRVGEGKVLGIVSEEVAREAWLEAIEEIEESEWKSSEHAEIGREIAEELGWLDDDE